jgi:taurine dioxygenase
VTLLPKGDVVEMTLTELQVDLDITLLSGTIGAVVRGIELRSVGDDEVAAIREVWLARKVVFFPGQHLDQDAHLAFASKFGTLTEGHPVLPGIKGYPNIFEIDYTATRELFANYGDVATRRQDSTGTRT